VEVSLATPDQTFNTEERFDMYLTATGLTDPAKGKASFLYQIGPEAHANLKRLRKQIIVIHIQRLARNSLTIS